MKPPAPSYTNKNSLLLSNLVSLIATLSNVDKTFTVGYANKKYSEIDYAKDLSKKINVKNESKEITKEEYFEKFPLIQYYMDEPLADPSAIMLYFVAIECIVPQILTLENTLDRGSGGMWINVENVEK